MGLDVRLAGEVSVEVDGVAVETAGLGRLGRVALAFLVTERHRPVTRDEVAEVLWGEDLPQSWDTSVRVVVSRLRALLGRAGLAPAEALTTTAGSYQLHLGPDTSVDVEAAAHLLARADAALASGQAEAARAAAADAATVAGRQFLPGAPGAWVERRQAELRELHLGALDTVAAASSACGDAAAAIRAAEEAVALEPFREPAWTRLMAAHVAAGSRSEALRTYERCRRLLAEELGVSPSPATEAAYVALLGEKAPEAPPPTRPASLIPPPLPLPLTTFVGRDDGLTEISRLLSSHRLVTLTGPGGVGKSRLALEAGHRLRRDASPDFPDGVVLVELASLTDPLLVDGRVLSALGLVEEPDRRPLATLVAHLGDRPLLLILDNCEHLLRPCAVLAEQVLSRCPGVRVLATSREALRLPAEATLAVDPLPAPDPRTLPPLPAGAAQEFAAVRLLVDRVTSVSPGFELTAADAEAAAQICHGLDGIPLALELAAAQTRAMSLGDIAKRLDDRFSLLTRGARTAPPRHQTLRAAIDWSYDALEGQERRLFDQLSVFEGGFTLRAAERVCESAGPPLEALTRLVETSLVAAETRADPTRYRLPETLRQYGKERLASSPDITRVRARHLTWATALADEAEAGLEGAAQATALAMLDSEQDNLRAALAWGASSASPAGAGLRAAAALGRFWELRGQLGEGRRALDAALSDDDGSQPGPRAKALNWSGILAQRQGDYVAARSHYQASLALMGEMGDRAGMAAALHGLGNVCALQGDATARFFYEECLTIGRELGDKATVAASLTNLGWLAHHHGDFTAARSLDEESLALRRELGDRHGMAVVLGNLGYLAFQEGDGERARRLHEESLALHRELGDRHGVAMALLNLGHLAFQDGEDGTAAELYGQSLTLRREIGDRHGEAGSLAALADLARAGGDAAGAQAMLEEALAVARDLGDQYRVAALLVRLGRLACERGEVTPAEALYRQALAAAGDLPPRVMVAEWLEGLAAAAAAGRSERAAVLLGAADVLRESVGAPLPPRDVSGLGEIAAATRRALGDETFDSAWTAGREMRFDEALRFGQGRDARPRP